MKKAILTLALCVVASGAFAQKKNVKEAYNIAKSKTPNFTEARALIKEAIANEETKNDPKTWFTAGCIEDEAFNAQKMKQMLGQKSNEDEMYTALMNELPFFLKCDTVDQMPDKKGRVKPKYTKKVKPILAANHKYYINGGAYYFDKKDYKKALECFEQFITIADLPMFEGSDVAARDSNFMTVNFYAAVAAIQEGDRSLSIPALSRAKKLDFRRNDVYQYLCSEYQQDKDTVNFEKTLKEGMKLFPEEKYYLLNLINNYVFSNRNKEAIEYLNEAIQREPNNPQYLNVMGYVYEKGKEDIDKAEEYYKKSLAVDPDFVESLSNLGRIYYNQAVKVLGNANLINDAEEYKAEKAKAVSIFDKARPFFEKAHNLKPKEKEYMIALRGIYYNMNLGDKLKAIETEMGSVN